MAILLDRRGRRREGDASSDEDALLLLQALTQLVFCVELVMLLRVELAALCEFLFETRDLAQLFENLPSLFDGRNVLRVDGGAVVKQRRIGSEGRCRGYKTNASTGATGSTVMRARARAG